MGKRGPSIKPFNPASLAQAFKKTCDKQGEASSAQLNRASWEWRKMLSGIRAEDESAIDALEDIGLSFKDHQLTCARIFFVDNFDFFTEALGLPTPLKRQAPTGQRSKAK